MSLRADGDPTEGYSDFDNNILFKHILGQLDSVSTVFYDVINNQCRPCARWYYTGWFEFHISLKFRRDIMNAKQMVAFGNRGYLKLKIK